MKYPALPVFAILGALLVLIPLPWHWRARNVATLSIIAWLFVMNVIYAVNTIVWAGSIRDVAPVYCDIATKLIIGASHALPLATLCICKHLEMVSSSRTVSYDVSDKKRRMIFEGVMCFVLPMIFMALHYIVQGHRYDIIQEFGCQPTIYISIPAIFIVWFPPLLFAVISFILAAMALHHFVRRRLVLAAHLQNANSALTPNRYIRLIAMALTIMTWNTSLTAFNLYNNVFPGLRPWTNWADVHSNFSRVDLFPTVFLPDYFIRAMMLFWWAMPVSSLIFFLFFGFGEEAMKEYRKVGAWISRVILRRKTNEKGELLGSTGNSRRRLHLVDLKNKNASMISKPIPGSFCKTSQSPSATVAGSPPPYKKSFDVVSPTSTSNCSTVVNANSPLKKANEIDLEAGDDFSYYAQSNASTATQLAPPAMVERSSSTRSSGPYISEPIPSPTLSYCSILSPSTAPSTSAFSPSSFPESVGPDSLNRASEMDLVESYYEMQRDIREEETRRTHLRGPASPAYHRPFSPTLYPVALPHPGSALPPVNGILVTVHRQASVDELPSTHS
uniref:Pheromone receptor n=1 Tax=Coprinopsis cinerea TaxID=5346 RepID=O74284_COPCI|nr:pheromone receptor [Coprinopsis cinerea]